MLSKPIFKKIISPVNTGTIIYNSHLLFRLWITATYMLVSASSLCLDVLVRIVNCNHKFQIDNRVQIIIKYDCLSRGNNGVWERLASVLAYSDGEVSDNGRYLLENVQLTVVKIVVSSFVLRFGKPLLSAPCIFAPFTTRSRLDAGTLATDATITAIRDSRVIN